MTVPNSAGAILALAAVGVVLMTAGAGVASAAPERSRPHSVPTSRISV